MDADTSLDHYQEFMDSIYTEERALGRKIKGYLLSMASRHDA
nr:hypothetical protein [uncultured Desulfobacter sp.]